MTLRKADRAAVRAIIRGVRKGGWDLNFVADGEEDVEVKTEEEALDAIFAVDMARLYVVNRADTTEGWLFFVLGNDPEEVLNDCTINLSDVVDPVTDAWM